MLAINEKKKKKNRSGGLALKSHKYSGDLRDSVLMSLRSLQRRKPMSREK